MAALVYREGGDVPRDVTRVVVHPSVRVLPPKAFRWCGRLEEVRLPEGLEEIGYGAFCKCPSLRRLGDLIPPTVVRIGDRAFVGCRTLSAVALAGIVKVERGAFAGCDSLERIAVPPRALVAVQRGCDRRNYTSRLVTDGTIAPICDVFVLIAPECLTALPESNLTGLGDSISTILNNGEGTEEDRLGRVRQEVRKEVRGEVSATLGLAFWKANIDEAERARIGAAKYHRKSTGGGRQVAGGYAVLAWEAREGCRGPGKGKEIAQNVLPFLDDLW